MDRRQLCCACGNNVSPLRGTGALVNSQLNLWMSRIVPSLDRLLMHVDELAYHSGGIGLPAAIDDDYVPMRSEEASSNPDQLAQSARLTREYGFTFRIVLFARRYRAMLDERLRPLGYGTARMETLATIAHSAEPSAQIAIAKRIGIEGPTLTRMLDSLESEGLVIRRPDPNDRRTKLIVLMQIADSFRASVLAGLSDEDLDLVNGLTGQLLADLRSAPQS
jgi:MarR family transcriptional regulator, transcriptional regulator for hemolysin